jgi:hypothetical protein
MPAVIRTADKYLSILLILSNPFSSKDHIRQDLQDLHVLYQRFPDETADEPTASRVKLHKELASIVPTSPQAIGIVRCLPGSGHENLSILLILSNFLLSVFSFYLYTSNAKVDQ